MATFPALISINARMCRVGDVIYGKQGTYGGTWLLFKYPITVTVIGERQLKGVNANGNPFSMDLVGRNDVLIELKGE